MRSQELLNLDSLMGSPKEVSVKWKEINIRNPGPSNILYYHSLTTAQHYERKCITSTIQYRNYWLTSFINIYLILNNKLLYINR